MKPTPAPITRASLTTTAAHNARWFARLAVGTAMLGSSALAVNNLWTGAVDNDWNNAGNWSLGRVPTNNNGQPVGDTFDDAVINSLTNFPVVTANWAATPRDLAVGLNAGNTGRVDQRAGIAANGGGNWSFIGRAGGTGTYNLANTAGTGGAFTGFATGTGSLTIGGRLYIGGNENAQGGNGTLNINTSGTLGMGSDFAVGASGATGLVNMDAGTLNTNGWSFIGKREAFDGGNGTLNLSGGTINHNGTRTFVGVGNAVGAFNMSGGTYNNPSGAGDAFFVVGSNNLGHASPSTVNLTGGTINANRLFSVGGVEPFGGNNDANFVNSGKGILTVNGATALLNVTGEFWAGQGANSVGTVNLSAGTIQVNNWVAIGRGGGTGSLNMTGGTFRKTTASGGNFIMAASGPATITQSGGLIDILSNEVWMSEANTGTYTLSGTGEFRSAANIVVARNGGSNGTMLLNGGILRAPRILGGGGNASVNFNGTQIIAPASQPVDFINNLDIASVQSGGLLIDSNGFNLTVPQLLNGSGGVVKSGVGTLSLTAANSFSGASSITGGKLVVTTKATGAGALAMSNGTTLGVTLAAADEEYIIPSLTVGAAGAIAEINLGAIAGNPSAGEAPFVITGAASLNGNLTINLLDTAPLVGSYPLIEYGSKTGAGNFVLGTLPLGVVANLDTSVPGIISLNVTSAALPRWNATNSNIWDTVTQNWVDLITVTPSTFTNGNPALFNDAATGPFLSGGSVVLNSTVNPGATTFNNSTINYALSGTGSIGSGSLIKQGTGSLTIDTVNTYTGVTRLEGGSVSVSTLTNGGVASPLGAATSSPSNLVFAGGTLNYTGPTVTIDRGYSFGSLVDTTVNSISTANNLTIAGQITAPDFGKMVKTGPGTLTFTFPGANFLARGAGIPAPLRANQGSIVLDGSGTQTNSVTGDFWVGSSQASGASAVLNNTSLSVSNYLAISRGNGTGGFTSDVTATNSTLTLGALSLAYGDGLAGHSGIANLTLNNSSMTVGDVNLGESAGGIGTVTLNGTSTFTATARTLLGNDAGASGTLIIADNSTLTRTGGYFSIGVNGTGVVTVKNSGVINAPTGDFNVSDVGASNGTLNIQDNATVTAGTAYVGKNAATGILNLSGSGSFTSGPLYIGQNTGATGTVNVTGGTLVAGANNEIRIGQTGTGIWNQSAGTVNISGWCVIGRFNGGNGTLNVSGGVFNQVQGDRTLIVGEDGLGVLNITNSGAVNSLGVETVVSNGANGNGTVNLDGGTLTTKRVREGAGGISAFNFDGGVLKAGTGANLNFMSGIDTALVEDGGAIIDTNGQTVGIGQSLDDDGSPSTLTKIGTGTLYANGFFSYNGLTTVSAGTLGGTGYIEGSVSVSTGATLAPGAPSGLLTAEGTVSFQTDANYEFVVAPDGSNGELTVGTLDLTNADLVITGTLTQPSYVLASYTTLVGNAPFASVPALPGTYQISYTGGQVIISRPPTPFETWIDSYFDDVVDPAIVGADADPDGDGDSNALEFMLGGNPSDGSDNAKVYKLTADSSDGGTAPELLLTIAVRDGTPAFGAGPSPSATQEGFTYTVQGSLNLATFTSPVSVVTPIVTTDLPTAPDGYNYRTFRLDGTDGLPGKGFLRVQITP